VYSQTFQSPTSPGPYPFLFASLCFYYKYVPTVHGTFFNVMGWKMNEVRGRREEQEAKREGGTPYRLA